jgi:WD40 repeat protein
MSRLWISDEISCLLVTRTGFKRVSGHLPTGGWTAGRFCWSPSGNEVLILNTSSDKSSGHTPASDESNFRSYLPSPATLIRFQTEETVSSQQIRIGESRPTAYTCHPSDSKYLVGCADGTLVEISATADSGVVGKSKVTSDEPDPELRDVSIRWCSYSFDGTYLAALLNSRPALVILNLKSKESQFYDSFDDTEGGLLEGPGTLSPDGRVLFVGTIGGGIVSLSLKDKIEVLKRYPGPTSDSRKFRSLSIAANERYVARAIGKSVFIWDIYCEDKIREVRVSTTLVENIKFVPSGDRFVSIDSNGRCLCWNASSGDYVAEITEDATWDSDISFAADGSTVVVRLKKRRGPSVFPLYPDTSSLVKQLKVLASRSEAVGAPAIQ